MEEIDKLLVKMHFRAKREAIIGIYSYCVALIMLLFGGSFLDVMAKD